MRDLSGYFIGLSIGLLLSLPTSGHAQSSGTPLTRPLTSAGFTIIRSVDGVDIYSHPDSGVVRVAAEGRIQARPDDVLAALLDYPEQIGVVHRLRESRILLCGTRELSVYQRIQLPVIDDRDFALRVRWGKDARSDNLRVDYAIDEKNDPPVRRGIVRVHRNNGLWQLRPIEAGHGTFVRFEVEIDFAGYVPRWMVRPGASRELPGLFRGIESLARAKMRRRLVCSR
jgi:hypothetical protein